MIDRLKQRIGLDLAMIYINCGMFTDVRDKLMERMGWTATECIEWDAQQEKERGKTPRGPLKPKPKKKSQPSMAGVKKPIHRRPGVIALREIQKYQKSTKLLIIFLAFARLVREIAQDFKMDLLFQCKALTTLQEVAEAYLVGVLSNANMIAMHAKCQSL